MKNIPFLDIAHRGASAIAPENTRKAFLEALKAGVDVIEFDVQCTKDKKLVVHHDSSIHRTSNGSGKIAFMTLEELQKFDFGFGASPEKILTLREALELIGEQAYVLIEPKFSVKGKEQLLLEEVQRAKSKSRIWIHSRHKSILKTLRHHDSEIRLGYVLILSLSHKLLLPYYRWWVRKNNISFFSINNLFLFRSSAKHFLQELKSMGVDVYLWTVNDLLSVQKAVSYGVRGIITNYPGTFKKSMREDMEELTNH